MDGSCRCEEIELLWDSEAKAYCQHLHRIEVREDGWAVVYECPNTGRLWLEDRPFSEAHGGGPIRLCRLYWTKK